MRKIALISLLGMTLAVPCSSVAAEVDWTAVDKALGKTAAVQGDVHRYGIPRSDLKVKVDGVTIKPALALGGWVAFEPAKDGTMLMGGKRSHSRYDQSPAKRHRDYRLAQSPDALNARYVLHAHPRAWRSGKARWIGPPSPS